MKLTVLGNQGPYPAPGGACSGYLVSQGDTHVLLDCGLGVLARLQEHISLGALSALVLTHLHFDHVSDAFDLQVAMEASGHACPPVFAPASPAPQRALLPEKARFETEFSVGPLSFRLYPARHPVEAYSVAVDGGGKRLVFTGDTNWHDGLVEACRGADLLLADSAFFHCEWGPEKPHLSARLCGELAAAAGAGALMLTHFPPGKDVDALAAEARACFARTRVSQPGERYDVTPGSLCW